MLISRSRKFIFVHIYKTGGTSIAAALKPFALNKVEKIFNRFSMAFNGRIIVNPQRFPDHATALQLIDGQGSRMFRSYFSFAFVRNPWDWQVSLYNYMLRNADHPEHNFILGLDGFAEYICWRCENMTPFQRDFIYDNEKLLVDYVGKYESITKDFQVICKRLGVSATLPVLNAYCERPYRTYYTYETRELIAKAYEHDILQFGYEF